MGDKHLLRLTQRGAKEDEWAPVSETVFPLLTKLPPELITVEKLEIGGQAKLTADGETLVNGT